MNDYTVYNKQVLKLAKVYYKIWKEDRSNKVLTNQSDRTFILAMYCGNILNGPVQYAWTPSRMEAANRIWEIIKHLYDDDIVIESSSFEVDNLSSYKNPY